MNTTAFVFPGQGSQFIGMGRDFADSWLERASLIIGIDLKKICWDGQEEELRKTEITQPAIFIVSVAALEKLKEAGFWPPGALAGHSLGEYTAIYAAKAISFEDGVKVLHLRGKFMQEAVPEGVGAMTAILFLDKEKVKECCEKAQGEVYPANFNSPDQIVISGETHAVERAAQLCIEAGAKKVVPLQVSAPFHCPLMKPAQEKLAEVLHRTKIKEAQITIYSNVTADCVESAFKIEKLLVEQVTAPVLWEDSIKNMIAVGINQFVEVGPGKVLSGLIKKIDPNVTVKSYEEILSEIKG